MRSNVDVSQFAEFLTRKGSLRPATVTLYTGHVRHAMRIMGMAPTVERVLFYQSQLPDNRRGAFRTAWRAFVEYGRSRGVAVPAPVFPDLRNHPLVVHPLLDDIMELIKHFPLSEVSELRASNMVPHNNGGWAIQMSANSNKRVPISPKMRARFLEYAPDLSNPTRFILRLTPNGTRLSEQQIERMISRRLERNRVG